MAFPTETVYGLGAAINRRGAVRRIFSVKGRPLGNPLIVHISHREQLEQVVSSVPPVAARLMTRFWPGPLTLVLPRAAALLSEISAGLPTVAVRMPAHPLALALIRAVGVPLVAPSANLSGRPSPTTPGHVLADLVGKIEAVIDGGPCRLGIESTVLDLTSGSSPVILRPGGVSREELERELGITVSSVGRFRGAGPPPRVTKPRPCLPRSGLLLIRGVPERRRRLIWSLIRYYRGRGMTVAWLNPAGAKGATSGKIGLAPLLYGRLRRCELRGVRVILAGEISPRGLGAGVMNRLQNLATRVIRV